MYIYVWVECLTNNNIFGGPSGRDKTHLVKNVCISSNDVKTARICVSERPPAVGQ